MSDITLKPCPFCGSDKSKIKEKRGTNHYYEKDGMKQWQRVTCSVRCTKCHARGTTVSADIDTSINHYDKLQLLRENASKLWNVRVIREVDHD